MAVVAQRQYLDRMAAVTLECDLARDAPFACAMPGAEFLAGCRIRRWRRGACGASQGARGGTGFSLGSRQRCTRIAARPRPHRHHHHRHPTHLGNYVGAIRPAIAASREPGVESFFFLADYHALIKCDDPERIERSRLEIAATWLAAGLDTERVVFYRQSDVPEIPELTWLLTCVTAKGQMNRAHAYKAAVDANAPKARTRTPASTWACTATPS
jgi:hypothetical protein